MALNFLVTGVKMLKKSLDKKKMKEKAKKFVGGDKEEKRAKVSKIMDKESSYGGKTKTKKPATISKSKLMKIDIDKVAKVTPDSAKIDYKAFTAKVDNIVGMTDALAFLTGAQSEQKKDELKLLRQQREKEKKRKKEAKLEKKDGILGKVGKGIKKVAQSPLDAITNFFTQMALGALALFLINNADKIKGIFKNIGENIEVYSKVLRLTIFGFANGMKLARAGFGLMATGVGKLLSPVQKMFSAVGSQIGNVLGSLGTKLKTIFLNLPGIKELTQMISGARKGADAASKIVSGKTKKIVNKLTGNVLKRGMERAPSRFFLKLFGKKGAKIFKQSAQAFQNLSILGKSIKIPIVGPLIVAVTSILAGDPLQKTLFRSIGAVFGGAIGSLGGPLGMIVGEILGEFLGTFLYEMFLGEGKGQSGKYLKQKFGELVSGVGKYGKMFLDFVMTQIGKFGNFLKDGFHRFVDDFPVIDISKMRLIPSGLGLVAKTFGVDNPKYMDGGKVNRIPDLSLLTPFGMGKLLPHLKNSFFPSKEKEPVESETSVSGGEEEKDMKGAKVETSDNTVPHTISATQETFDGKGGSTYAELGEKDTSSTSSTVSDVSSKATYEEVPAGTVILEKPQRSDFKGRSGAAQFKKAMIMYNNQKEMLNSYQKTQMKASLAKI